MITYPYATGDLIETPNTYFYSEYAGHDFIIAWRHERATVLAELPEAVPPAPAKPADPASRRSAELLERALGGDISLREAFIKKFEIHKRVHDGYDESFRALDKAARRSLPLYLRAADLFQAVYEESHALRHLNAYLKCLDTLCAEAASLSAELSARLAWHLDREASYIDALMTKRGIAP
ncbi:MAG: hypothetical protein O2967_14340 [Proteobacteria bacterium]|nr:hypothetical protein [Pseudomonadota bacterium]